MYKYLFFIILGILLFIFLNNYNTFSIGIPTYSIQSIDPIITFSPAPESEHTFTGDTPVIATNGNGQTLQEYIYAQDDSAFPGGYTNYVLVSESDPESDVEEGDPCNETLCEGIPTCDDLIRCKLNSFGFSETNIALLLDQYHNYDISYILLQRLNFSKACSTRLGNSSPAHLFSYDLLEMIGQQVGQVGQPAQYNELNLVGGYFDFDDLIDIINLLTHENIFDGRNNFDFLSELIFMIIKALRLGISVEYIINSLNGVNIFYNAGPGLGVPVDTLEQLSDVGFNIDYIRYWFVVLYLNVFTTFFSDVNPNMITYESRSRYLDAFKDDSDFTGDYTDL
jgi:hypothetical protein